MDLDDQLNLGHLLLQDRKCRVCGQMKNLIDGVYLTRNISGPLPSSYSYECKVCTIQRIVKSRKERPFCDWGYPDW